MSKEDTETIGRLLDQLTFNNEGLIPAIAQQFDSGEILMLAWMSPESIEATLVEERVVYWSRSRRKLWRKGETSGQVQTLKEFRWDCDNDTILLQVDQSGVACHTGRRNCFFNSVRDGNITKNSRVDVDPESLSNR